ncbi:glycosyltransferase family 32 protein [Gorillibacterium timonense]|uniref:glycosyltransferase family 32 protein n=1 Tax=Gorillibacterium timonense TaxID=1689269 RepID=UPI00071D33CF|nr:glycosyltransferase [Gorillibacterium timonense]
MTKADPIPKIIHSCWFGRGEKPAKIRMCQESWPKHLSGYAFMEWNEDTFDLSSNRYVQEAYANGKFAFVSDYVRLYALYTHGGIYMDTDVEVLKPLDRFLGHEAFSGFEDERHVPTGLMGAQPGHRWIKELLDDYVDRPFVRADGSLDLTTNTKLITENAKAHGFIPNGLFQELDNGVTLYPRTYFCPYDYINGANYLSGESYAIHHFAKSWLPPSVRRRSELKRRIARILGPSAIARMRALLKAGQ